MDVATSNMSSNSVSLLTGNGLGSFGIATNFSVGTNPLGIVSGDFNSDGKLDLSVSNWNSSNLSLLVGNGLGSFAPSATLARAGESPRLWTWVLPEDRSQGCTPYLSRPPRLFGARN